MGNHVCFAHVVSALYPAEVFTGLSLRLAGWRAVTHHCLHHRPRLRHQAFNINLPAGWKFEGTVLPGPECSRIPMPVFRAYSADGLTEMRLLPQRPIVLALCGAVG